MGPNGCGKTTLLKILLGELTPQGGTVVHGTRLQPVYFDQHREQLDERLTVKESVAGGSEMIEINGRKRHIYGYLEDFLFTPDRARTPVKALSGGERNRLLIARLFTKPANVLVLDEPTNDLDVETLELLENVLVEFSGTLLLVSHDRVMLDNVVTSTLVFEGDGRVCDYVGGYEDWLRQRPASAASSRPAEAKPKLAESGTDAAKPKRGADKLSFKETRELAELPARIESLEQEQADLHAGLADPALYQADGGEVAKVKARLEVVDATLEDAYARWEVLEGRR
jgi:ATP-binding cassette subfamily F protein uup